jgi:hypothetical protein
MLFLAGTAAVLCGLLVTARMGAGPRLLLINLVALGVGVALVAIVRLMPSPSPSVRSAALLAIPAALLATAFFGTSSEGASRWIHLGGLSLQPGLILVPVLLLGHVARPDRWSGLAVALAAFAMALQPDRSLAAAIAAVTLVDAIRRRSTDAWATAFAPLAAFAAALARPDLLPPVPYVDQILWAAFTAAPLAGAAVWAGTLLLFAPALTLWRAGERHQAAAFATLWATLVASAAIANYPTPLVGYGASCIIGYLLAALALPKYGSHASIRSPELAPNPSDPPAGFRIAAHH